MLTDRLSSSLKPLLAEDVEYWLWNDGLGCLDMLGARPLFRDVRLEEGAEEVAEEEPTANPSPLRAPTGERASTTVLLLWRRPLVVLVLPFLACFERLPKIDVAGVVGRS